MIPRCFTQLTQSFATSIKSFSKWALSCDKTWEFWSGQRRSNPRYPRVAATVARGCSVTLQYRVRAMTLKYCRQTRRKSLHDRRREINRERGSVEWDLWENFSVDAGIIKFTVIAGSWTASMTSLAIDDLLLLPMFWRTESLRKTSSNESALYRLSKSSGDCSAKNFPPRIIPTMWAWRVSSM